MFSGQEARNLVQLIAGSEIGLCVHIGKTKAFHIVHKPSTHYSQSIAFLLPVKHISISYKKCLLNLVTRII